MSGAFRVDAAIAGGGVIGLSLGLELLRRGLTVAIMERGRLMRGASRAAAGMLAVHDPHSPPNLLPLALRSWEIYPEYLARVEELSGRKVPLRTRMALQYVAAIGATGQLVSAAELAGFAPGLRMAEQKFTCLDEASLDPGDLCEALPLAFAAAGGVVLEDTELRGIESLVNGVVAQTSQSLVSAATFVNCCGAWAGGPELSRLPVRPVKGQMLNLQCAPESLRCVVRSPGVYLVPRGDGRVAVGATVEEAGFDLQLVDSAIKGLARAALKLIPDAWRPQPQEAWAGLRPGTPDGLPILGAAGRAHCWYATGHYRDGILLAPVTAQLMAQAILGERTEIPLEAFSAKRFELELK